MRLASFVLVLPLAAAGLALPVAHAQSPVVAAAPIPSIVTSGMGEARTAPDRALIQIGVQSRGATAAAAASANATRQRAVIDAIVAAGIPRAQIATTGYNVFPDMRHDPATGQSRVTGYVVSNVVRVEIRQLEQVSRVIDAALAKGANQVNSLNFYKENTSAERQEALAQAVQKARADAEVLARAAGGSLGELLELTTGAVGGPIPVFKDMRMAAEPAQASTPIEAGEEVVRQSVMARWRFVPAR